MGLMQTNLDSLDFAKLYKEQMKNSTFKGKKSDDWDKKIGRASCRERVSLVV